VITDDALICWSVSKSTKAQDGNKVWQMCPEISLNIACHDTYALHLPSCPVSEDIF